MKTLRTLFAPAVLVSALFGSALASRIPLDTDYAADVEFALKELKQRCGHFFDRKEINWKKVEKEFKKAGKGVSTDEEHLELMVRLLARLEDGHAQVRKSEATESVDWPEVFGVQSKGPGIFLCRVGKKYYVKNAWGDAAELGIEPGMEVVKLGDTKTKKWIAARSAEVCDHRSFSTDAQAFFYTTHWGMAHAEGTRIPIELKTRAGKKKKRTLTCTEKSYIPHGPAVPVEALKGKGDSIYYGRTPNGFGYMHVRRVKGAIIEELDTALAELHDVPGMILDFRGNSGGGCDHDAFEARFVPSGHKLPRMARAALASQGAEPYGGPLVVIVDATCRSSGETLSGMFKEDGRGYMIGESSTAGMSSQKELIELPSGLFSLYVSVGSNRSSFNGGRGIEGLGVPPQELVEYEPDDLAAGVDTMIFRAEELLGKFPQKEVRYDPGDYDWGE